MIELRIDSAASLLAQSWARGKLQTFMCDDYEYAYFDRGERDAVILQEGDRLTFASGVEMEGNVIRFLDSTKLIYDGTWSYECPSKKRGWMQIKSKRFRVAKWGFPKGELPHMEVAGPIIRPDPSVFSEFLLKDDTRQ